MDQPIPSNHQTSFKFPVTEAGLKDLVFLQTGVNIVGLDRVVEALDRLGMTRHQKAALKAIEILEAMRDNVLPPSPCSGSQKKGLR